MICVDCPLTAALSAATALTYYLGSLWRSLQWSRGLPPLSVFVEHVQTLQGEKQVARANVHPTKNGTQKNSRRRRLPISRGPRSSVDQPLYSSREPSAGEIKQLFSLFCALFHKKQQKKSYRSDNLLAFLFGGDSKLSVTPSWCTRLLHLQWK